MLTSNEARHSTQRCSECRRQRSEVQGIKQIMTHKRCSSVPTEFSMRPLAWAWLLEHVRYAAGLSTHESLHICTFASAY